MRYALRALLATVLVATMSLMVAPVASALPALPHPAEGFPTALPTGTHQVGVDIRHYPVGGSDIKVTTWYPATHAKNAKPYQTADGVRGVAVRDAAPERNGGPYPLIVFSPGLGAPGDGYYFYTQNLASHGYVVIGIDHLDSKPTTTLGFWERNNPVQTTVRALGDLAATNPSDSVFAIMGDWFKKTQFGMTYRPAEITRGLDVTLARNRASGDRLRGMINPDQIGMSGHSLGAAYTLLYGGQAINCDYPMTAADRNLSGYITDIDPCAMPVRARSKDPHLFRDQRIKAILPLAAPVFINDRQIVRASRDIKIPLMFLTGEDPYLESSRKPQWQTYQGASGPKYFVEITNTNHFMVTDMVTANPAAAKALNLAGYTEFGPMASVYMRYSSAFFDRYLKNDVAKEAVLHRKGPGPVWDVHYDD